MIVASECEFDNDIHRLVNSLSYQDPTSCSLDDLMGISDRYGDIVYNLISLREMYSKCVYVVYVMCVYVCVCDVSRWACMQISSLYQQGCWHR